MQTLTPPQASVKFPVSHEPLEILDTYCGEGAVSLGLKLAFPNARITGVDILNYKRRYLYNFVQADAPIYIVENGHKYDFIWASPPCQHYSKATAQQRQLGVLYSDLVQSTRDALIQTGVPYIIENVPQAPLRSPITLCGQMFRSRVRLLRHRIFEANFRIEQPEHVSHKGLVRGATPQDDFAVVVLNAWNSNDYSDNTKDVWARAMGGTNWMTMKGMSQAVPPVYAIYLAQYIPLPLLPATPQPPFWPVQARSRP